MSSHRKIFLFVATPLLILLGLTIYLGFNRDNRAVSTRFDQTEIQSRSTNDSTINRQDSDSPPLLLKSIGINLDTYNPATGMAGDLKFTKANFGSQMNLLFTDFGYSIKGNVTSAGQDKVSPQPTFIAPLGTKVMALVDGIVVDIPKLYSNDYSVMVAPDKNSSWRYETEHVINPVVKVGDRVKAGQVVAEVSGYDAKGYDGLGLFEIGILKGGNPPSHICPFNYLDPSIKESVQAKLTQLYQDWEDYRGDNSLYDQSKLIVPGCLTLDSVPG